MMLRRSSVLTVVLLILFALGACSAAAPAGDTATEPATTAGDAAATPEPSDTPSETPSDAADEAVIRIGWGGYPDSFNPGLGTLTEAYTLYGLVYDALYTLNLDGTYSFEMIEEVQSDGEGRVWDFRLRDGMTFHDGEPVTADDVVFSLNLYQTTEDFVFLPAYTGYFETVEKLDDLNVRLTLTEPIPNLESQLVFLFILPEHIWSAVENPAEFENLEFIGSGPFKLREARQNEFVALEAHTGHANRPRITGAVFQTFDNQDALVQALRTDQLDMITEFPNTAIAALRNAENVEVVSGAPASPGLSDIIFNITAEENCPPEDGVCSGHPALKDVNVRRALAHATDKQNIIDVVLLGLGAPGLTLVPDGMGVFYNDTLEDYAFDIAQANQILDDAGYADTDNDGVREMPDGSRPLTLRLNWPSDSANYPRVAELIAGTWGQAGVQLELQALDPDTLVSVCCPAFDFDVIIWGWGSDPDPAFLLSVMTTGEIPTGTSETGYSNPEYDALFAAQATELDRERRIEIIHQMQEIALRDLPYIIPYYDLAVQAYRTDRFQGWITDQGKIELSDRSSLLVIEPVE